MLRGYSWHNAWNSCPFAQGNVLTLIGLGFGSPGRSVQEGETGEKHDKNKVPEEALRLETLPNVSLKVVTIRRERFTEMFLSKEQICVSCKAQRWAGGHAVHSHNEEEKEKSGSIRDSVLTLFSLRQSLEVTRVFLY